MVVCDICKTKKNLVYAEIGDKAINLFGIPLQDCKHYTLCNKCARKLKRYIRYEQAMHERKGEK